MQPAFQVVIPARMRSTRLPGKMLAEIAGKPLVAWVAERAKQSGAKSVTIATDHEDIARGELRCQPAARGGGDGDPAVAGGLVEPERESTPLGSDEVNLHHDGHGPGQALVDTE